MIDSRSPFILGNAVYTAQVPQTFLHVVRPLHQSKDTLNYSRPTLMTAKKSRRELEMEYGRRIVEQSLIVWRALTKAVENDKNIADIVVEAKAPSRDMEDFY